MIDEIQVFASTGIPLYYYNEDNNVDFDNRSFLQASFLSAITQFAQELDNGDVEVIQMQRKSYVMNKQGNVIIVFTAENDKYEETSDKIKIAGKFISEKVKYYDIQDDVLDTRTYQPVLAEFNDFLQKEKIVISSENKIDRFKDTVDSLIFKTVGYNPGSCNIGPKQRLLRMTYALITFALSMGLFTAILLLKLPIITFGLVFIINYFAFLSILQAAFKFCVANALVGSYNMN